MTSMKEYEKPIYESQVKQQNQLLDNSIALYNDIEEWTNAISKETDSYNRSEAYRKMALTYWPLLIDLLVQLNFAPYTWIKQRTVTILQNASFNIRRYLEKSSHTEAQVTELQLNTV